MLICCTVPMTDNSMFFRKTSLKLLALWSQKMDALIFSKRTKFDRIKCIWTLFMSMTFFSGLLLSSTWKLLSYCKNLGFLLIYIWNLSVALRYMSETSSFLRSGVCILFTGVCFGFSGVFSSTSTSFLLMITSSSEPLF